MLRYFTWSPEPIRSLLVAFFLLLPVSCRQVVDCVNVKQLAPEVVAYGQQSDAWYEYMPRYAPYFCLKTRYSLSWHDPEMRLGYWRLLHPEPPHRVIMEAREDTLYIHRGFVWDGVSFGNTLVRELVPSMLHDALYFARQGEAPFSRREADLVYLRAARRYACRGRFSDYLGVRTFGGFFGRPDGVPAPLVVRTDARTPLAALPAGETRFISLQP